MRQLITRIDDDLHLRLKARAAEEARSVNDLVVELLRSAVDDHRASIRRQLDRLGLRVVPAQLSEPVPLLESVLDAHRGLGSPLSDSLGDERAER